jgi:hypothetical protein
VSGRAHLLARRGAQGAVLGRAGGDADGARWLIDETEGDGALATRVRLPDGVDVEAGARLVVHGAWTAEPERERWIWIATDVARFADAPALDPAHAPGLSPAPARDGEVETDAGAELPIGSIAQAAPGTQVLVHVLAAPAKPGDGWGISDDPRADAPQAYLVLPGEHAIYGGLDLRAPDERWSLAVGTRYAVRVDRVVPRRGPPRVLYTRSPPAAADAEKK